MLTELQQAAADRYADALYDDEYRRCHRLNPERLAGLSQDELTAFRAKLQVDADNLVQSILTTAGLMESYQRGRFHPDNANSRRMLESVLGIALPPTVGGTRDAIREYLGEFWDNWHAARKAEYAAAAEERERKRLQEIHDKRDKLREKFIGTRTVSGDEPADLARYLGIDVHPRTVSMLRKRVKWINGEQASISGNGHVDSAFRLYRQVSGIVEQTQPATN